MEEACWSVCLFCVTWSDEGFERGVGAMVSFSLSLSLQRKLGDEEGVCSQRFVCLGKLR